MRIAYLSIHWPRTIHSGVGIKMLQQMKVWKQEGHEVCFFSHTSPHHRPEELIPGPKSFYQEYSGTFGSLRREFSRAQAASRLLAQVTSYHPDLIYLRSAMYVYPLHRLASIAPVVIEINTNEAAQHSLLGKIYTWYNMATRAVLLRTVSGMVSVSNEIAASPDVTRFQKPVSVIANGFDFSEIQPLPAPNNLQPRLVFIGSPDNPWHGVEKLVSLARSYPDLTIDVVGYDHLDTISTIPPNLILHGYLNKDAYLGILAQAEAAVGSMALHRIGLYEASPLKTRETLAYGLPLILPYRDTDLDDLEYDWLLKIPNCEDNLETHGQAVHDFAYRMRGCRADRSLIAGRVDAHQKERQRLEIFCQAARRAGGQG